MGGYYERETKPARDTLKEMEAEILSYIGDAACDGQSDCALIAMRGREAATVYRAYNRATVDEVHLKEMVAEYNRMGRIIRKQEGLATIAFNPPVPDVICLHGRCTLVRRPDR